MGTRPKGEVPGQVPTAGHPTAKLGAKLKPGDKLPSFHALCAQYQASSTVVRGAMLVLKAEGLLDGRQGKGVYVVDPLPQR